MRPLVRRLTLVVGLTVILVAVGSMPAFADNCSSMSDCAAVIRWFVAMGVGLVLFGILAGLALPKLAIGSILLFGLKLGGVISSAANWADLVTGHDQRGRPVDREKAARSFASGLFWNRYGRVLRHVRGRTRTPFGRAGGRAADAMDSARSTVGDARDTWDLGGRVGGGGGMPGGGTTGGGSGPPAGSASTGSASTGSASTGTGSTGSGRSGSGTSWGQPGSSTPGAPDSGGAGDGSGTSGTGTDQGTGDGSGTSTGDGSTGSTGDAGGSTGTEGGAPAGGDGEGATADDSATGGSAGSGGTGGGGGGFPWSAEQPAAPDQPVASEPVGDPDADPGADEDDEDPEVTPEREAEPAYRDDGSSGTEEESSPEREAEPVFRDPPDPEQQPPDDQPPAPERP